MTRGIQTYDIPQSLGGGVVTHFMRSYAGNHDPIWIEGARAGLVVTLTSTRGDNIVSQRRITNGDGEVSFDLFPYIQQLVISDSPEGNLCHSVAAVMKENERLTMTVSDGTTTETIAVQLAHAIWGSHEISEYYTREMTAYTGKPWELWYDGRSYTLSAITELESGDYTFSWGYLICTLHISNETCGEYLRWLNHRGEICFKLFRVKGDSSETQRTAVVAPQQPTVDYDSDGWYKGDGTVQTATNVRTLELEAPFVKAGEVAELRDLLAATCVDRYMGGGMWQRVHVKAGTLEVESAEYQGFGISIVVPTFNPLTL